MANDDKKKLFEGLLQQKLNVDGEQKANQYVEMADVPLPEEEVETGASKQDIKLKMARLAKMGAIGMGTTAMGAGLASVGFAMSAARSELGDGRVDVKSIARKADQLGKKVPRETARYLRTSSGEYSPSSPAMHRKTPIANHADSVGRSEHIESEESQHEGSSSPLLGRPAPSLQLKIASDAGSSFDDDKPRSDISLSHSSAEERSTPKSGVKTPSPAPLSPALKLPTTVGVTKVNENNSKSLPTSPVGAKLKEPIVSGLALPNTVASQMPKAGTVGSNPFKLSAEAKAPSAIHAPTSPVRLSNTFSAPGRKPTSPTGGTIQPLSPSKSIATQSFSQIAPSKAQPLSPSKAMAGAAAKAVPEKAPTPAPVVEEEVTDPNRKYSLEELQKGVPPGVDPNKKENYLKLAAFKKVFGVDPEAYAKFPEWKKINLRKESKLF